MTDKVEQIKAEMLDATESLGISQEEYEKIVDECIFGKEEHVSDELEDFAKRESELFANREYEIGDIDKSALMKGFYWGCKAGGNWQKHQIMKGTIDAFIDKGSIKLCQWPLDEKYGRNRDKVKLIIIKED